MTRSGGARLAAAAASGALLAFSRAPLDLGPVGIIALLPLLWALRDRSPRAAAGLAFVGGVVYYSLLTPWIWFFGAVAMVPYLIAMALYWAAAGGVIGAFSAMGVRSPWLTGAIWVAVEAVMSRWPVGGFSWGEVGYAFHDLPAARSAAALGGVPFLSFLAVVTSGLVLDALLAARSGDRRSVARPLIACAAIVVAVLAAHALRMRPTPAGTLRFALLQGNDRNRDLTDEEIRSRYLPESHFDLAAGLHGHYDLVVFPESSMDADPRSDTYLAANLSAVARRLDSAVLANGPAASPDGRRLNLDVFYDPDGELAGTYAKRHLVPYGEWVPLRDRLTWIKALDQIPRDTAPGTEPGLFDVAGVRVGTVICFESAFGPQIRGLVRDGARLVVVSTNNRSYRRSANSAQHVAISQMRAAETGRPVLQASISGISAVIDADGDIISSTGLFRRPTLTGTLDATGGQTLYVRFGDWAVLASLLLIAVAGLRGVALRRRRSVDSPVVASAPHDIPGTLLGPPEAT